MQHESTHDTVERRILEQIERGVQIMLDHLGSVTEPTTRMGNQYGAALQPQHRCTPLEQRRCVVPCAAASIEHPLPGDIADEGEHGRSIDVGVPGTGIGMLGEIVTIGVVVRQVGSHTEESC